MNSKRQAGLALLVAAIVGAAGFLVNWMRPNTEMVERASQALMSATVHDLGGNPQTLSRWAGKTLVVNFWATWCVPCRNEIPALIRTQAKYADKGVQLVGIGIDNAAKIIDYATEMKIDYMLLTGGKEILDMTTALGNAAGALPFTIVLDRSGKVAFVHTGALTDASLDAVLAPLL